MIDYSQNDIRWKNNKIGFDTGPTDTIGNYGCYLTAIANVCSWAGQELTPQNINDICKQNSWFAASDLVSIDNVPSRLCNNLTFNGRTDWNDAVSMNFFADASDPNVTYIIKIDSSLAPGLQSHFVMVWERLGDNDLEILDSWDGVKKPLSHYGNPSVITYSATKFTKQVISTAAPAAPTYTTDIQPFTGAYTVSGDKWNLDLSNFDTIATSPVSGIPSIPITFTAQLKRSDLPQYTYYLEDANIHQGYNSLDCQPYTPPVVAAPYIPPAAPVTVALAETYKLLTALPYYTTMNDLQTNRSSAGILPVGTYYVLAKNGSNDIYYNVTTTNMSNINHWINTLDNKVVVVPPMVAIPAPKPIVTLTPKVETSSEVMQSFSWFDPSKEHKPVVYKIEKSIKVYDQVHTGQAIPIETGKDIEVYGTFTKDGYIYLRPLTSLDEQGMYYYYGIVTTDIYSGAPYLSKETTQGDTVYYDAELYINKAVKTLEGVFRWLKRK